MDKAAEIQAFLEFVGKLEKFAPEGAYFQELVEHQLLIEQNIRDDSPPLLGVFVPQAVYTELQASRLRLRQELDEVQEFDIRELRKKQVRLQEERMRAQMRVEELSHDLLNFSKVLGDSA